ncbi:MAG: topoisomerase DNA-binding C4 zinc finger domain-containing protein [Desulfovibrio sp.]|nr:topoisomerase DNA-binding C4 zinc finger domain-containing protein [Desulfovibrio sp.]
MSQALQEEVAEVFSCPKCQKALRRMARKNDPTVFFWGCTGYQDGCDFVCDDDDGKPFLARCPECGEVLSRKISSKTGRVYVACFNKEKHSDHDVHFFSDDGTPQVKKEYPKAKGEFLCPECHQPLLYRTITKGRFAGQKNIFLCPNKEGHKSKATLFFDDVDGRPNFVQGDA